MAYGDVGGPVTELVITCRTKSSGDVDIVKGQAVKLSDGYVVDNDTADEDPVFGQAQADSTGNNDVIPVKVRGVCIFEYEGSAPMQRFKVNFAVATQIPEPTTGALVAMGIAVFVAWRRSHRCARTW